MPLYKGLTNRGEKNAYKKRDREPDYGPLRWDLWSWWQSKEELDVKYAEWRKVEPQLDEGVDELIIYIEAMTGISDESLLIYKEVKEIKIRYK